MLFLSIYLKHLLNTLLDKIRVSFLPSSITVYWFMSWSMSPDCGQNKIQLIPTFTFLNDPEAPIPQSLWNTNGTQFKKHQKCDLKPFLSSKLKNEEETEKPPEVSWRTHICSHVSLRVSSAVLSWRPTWPRPSRRSAAFSSSSWWGCCSGQVSATPAFYPERHQTRPPTLSDRLVSKERRALRDVRNMVVICSCSSATLTSLI